MSRYILDTNILSYLIDINSQYHTKTKEFLNSLKAQDELSTTTLTLLELNYTLEVLNDKSTYNLFKQAIEKIENSLNIYTIEIETTKIFSKLKQNYKKATGINSRAAKKNDIDLIIASIAIEKNATLVSNDKIFNTIAKLSNLKLLTI